MADDPSLTLLARCPLFAGVLPDDLRDVARHLRRRRFRRGEVIFHQGDPGDSLHIIASGAVKILLPSAEGDEAIIATLHAGDFFGELALIEEHPRSATVVADEPTECILFVAWEFTALLKEFPEMAIPLMNALIARLHRREHHLR